MRKIYSIVALALGALLLTGCPPKDNYSLTVTPSEIKDVPYTGDTKTVEIDASHTWSITNALEIPEWITIAEEELDGAAGKTTITLTIELNRGDVRDFDIEVACGGVKKTIKVNQLAPEPIIVNTSASLKDMRYTGATATLNVISMLSWEVTAKPTWVTLSAEEGEGDAELTLTLVENKEGKVLEGEIVFEAGENSVTLEISQQYGMYMPDPVLRTVLENNNNIKVLDAENGIFEFTEYGSYTSSAYVTGDLKSLKGLEFFTSFNTLTVIGSTATSFDYSPVADRLTSLTLDGLAKFNEIDFAELPKLQSLNLKNLTALTEVDLSPLAESLIYTLGIENVKFEVDLSQVPNLGTFNVKNMPDMTTLDIAGHENLTTIMVAGTGITSLVTENNAKLATINIQGSLKSIDISGAPAINNITTDAVSGSMYDRWDEVFNLAKAVGLEEFTANAHAKVIKILCDGNPTLKKIIVQDNPTLTVAKITNNPELNYFDATGSENLALSWSNNADPYEVIPSDLTKTFVKDAAFRNELKELGLVNVVNEATGEVEYTAAAQTVTSLDLSDLDIQSLSGMSYFPALESLNISGNTAITIIPFGDMPTLKTLDCSGLTGITDLTVPATAVNLTTLICSDNPNLKSVNVTTTVTTLDISNTGITSYYVPMDLETLKCHGIQLTDMTFAIPFSGNPKIANIYFKENVNAISEGTLDLSDANVKKFDATSGGFFGGKPMPWTKVTCSNNTVIEEISFSKNTQAITEITLTNNTNLKTLTLTGATGAATIPVTESGNNNGEALVIAR